MFNLVSGNNALAFAMIIRLAPDLVEEIKRLEAQGGSARMKFDSNLNNPSGNRLVFNLNSFDNSPMTCQNVEFDYGICRSSRMLAEKKLCANGFVVWWH
ncbi:hypothetical protein K1719_032517 [Acacia pycnantha]|nr:hypothetical protein K1719_032517 [Acacia pycnantha]